MSSLNIHKFALFYSTSATTFFGLWIPIPFTSYNNQVRVRPEALLAHNLRTAEFFLSGLLSSSGSAQAL